MVNESLKRRIQELERKANVCKYAIEDLNKTQIYLKHRLEAIEKVIENGEEG